MQTKVKGLLRAIVDNTPGMGYLQIDVEGTFEDERELLWEWFHVPINEAIGLKCGTYIYAYSDAIDFDLPEADYDLIVLNPNCEEEHVKLYYEG